MISKTSQQDLILQHTQSKIELQDKLKIIKQKKHHNSIAIVSGAVAFVASCIGIFLPFVTGDNFGITKKLHDRNISLSGHIEKASDNSNQYMTFLIAAISAFLFTNKMVDKNRDNDKQMSELEVQLKCIESLIAQIKAEMQKSERQ